MFPALAILSGAVMAEGLRSPRGIAFVGLGFVAAGAILDPRIPPTVRLALLGSVLVIAALIWCARLAATHISIARLPMIAPTAVAARSIGFVMPFLTAPLHEFLRRLVALSICLFLVGCGAARLRGLYFFLSPTPLERIATAAASNIGGDTILGLVLDRKDGVSIFGPTLAFYSQRPVRVAWGLENLRLLTSDSSDMEIILDRRFMEDLSDKYTFVVLKEEPPFVWTRIRRVSSAE
jgi:hypothetical protein